MVTEKIFEAALGIASPWYIAGMNFESGQGKKLGKRQVRVDFEVGTRFAVLGHPGEHPVHDTVTKTYRYLNFFQHVCDLEVRLPRVMLPDGSLRLHTAVRGICAAVVPGDAFHSGRSRHRAVGLPGYDAVQSVRG